MCCTQYASKFGKLDSGPGLVKVSFHSSTREGQCQKMFKLLHDCTHFTCWQSNAQNSPSQVSIVCELRNFRWSSQIQKRQRNQRSNCNIHWIIEKAREFQKNISFCFIDCAKAFDCVKVKVTQWCPSLCDPIDSPWNSPGHNTRVSSLSLSQGIFPTQV